MLKPRAWQAEVGPGNGATVAAFSVLAIKHTCERWVDLRSGTLAPHTLEFLIALLHVHELAAFLIALRPGSLVHQLAFELRTLADRALAGVVAFRLVDGHESPPEESQEQNDRQGNADKPK